MSTFVEIDGSEGEGGGQMLRSSLALSVLTGRPFKVINIRANRKKPGLAAQHLASVRAAAAISQGQYKGGSIGSTVLVFEPGEVKAGNYHFAVGTAGATALVLHTVYLPLALKAQGPSQVTITGGTHALAAPCFHSLTGDWAGYLNKVGIDINVTMTRPGFYPRGGGEIVATIQPAAEVRGLTLTSRGEITTAGGFAAVADLPESIGKRLSRRLTERLKRAGVESHIPVETWENGPGCVAAITFRQAPGQPVFYSVGERGRPAEAVADDAADEALAFRDSGCPVDPHMADQLVLPLAFAKWPSEFKISKITQHLITNMDIIRRFVEREIAIEGDLGLPGFVRVN
ncbi:MAG TPA: RNA 3'-terminal phosphate cyclase [Fimbriiglobus sp.]|jgi:RNA 3'-terminal phosphate cyclase (ATP)